MVQYDHMSDFKGKKIAVLGLGIEGDSVIRFLHGKGAEITVFDEKDENEIQQEFLHNAKSEGCSFRKESIAELDLTPFDIIVRSPGIKLSLPSLQNAKYKNVAITSATKLFFEECPGKIIGVTGTKGKGTTSTLIFEILKNEGKSVFLGGNIGNPPLDFLSEVTKDSYVVLELSSFQLQDLEVSPHIAVLLMVTSEHMDYHGSVQEYVEAKRNLLRFQTPDDFTVINRDYPASNESDIYTDSKIYKISREQEVEQGCFVRGDSIWIRMDGREEKVLEIDQIVLPGRHNLENVCAAILASLFAGASMKAIVTVLKSFSGLPYRLELIRTVRGVRYYNDSFSTTPETAIAAIEAFSEPEILIFGGSSKNSDFKELGKVISEAKNIKAIIGIGEEWIRIKSEIENLNSKTKIVEDCKNMDEVVKRASEIGTLGDLVILSPACASFDMFKNYKERGNEFNKAVMDL